MIKRVEHLAVAVRNLEETKKREWREDCRLTEIPGVRKEVLAGAKNPLGIILQVFEWLGEYKKATPETRMTKVWG